MTDSSIDPLERALADLTAPQGQSTELWRAALARTPNPAPRSYLSAPLLAASGVSLAVLITLVTLQPFPGPWTPVGGSLAAATGPAMTPAGVGERDHAARTPGRDAQLADDSRQRAQKSELAKGPKAGSAPAPSPSAAVAQESAAPSPAELKDGARRQAADERTDALAKETAPQPATTSAGAAKNETVDSAFASREELAAGAGGAAPAQPPAAPPMAAPLAPALPLPRTIGASGWFYSAAVAGIPLWIALLVITILRRSASARAAHFARPEPPPVV